MTIKQNGGVFGRNPTFNDVTIEGQLTFDGDIDVGSDLKVDGDLNVIGTTTLDGAVDVNMGNSTVDFSSGDSGYIKIQHVSRGGDYRLKVNGSNADYLDFQNGASQKLIRMASAGDVTIYNNLVMSTAGAGIDFSATSDGSGTATSELFDDYEEGTFTPVVAGTSTAGTYSYSGQTGRYTKIGDSVRIDITLSGITADSAGSGSLKITGLPYSADGTNVGPVWARTLNFDNSAAYLVATTSGTNLFIYEVVDNASGSNVNVADISSGNTLLAITLTYKV